MTQTNRAIPLLASINPVDACQGASDGLDSQNLANHFTRVCKVFHYHTMGTQYGLQNIKSSKLVFLDFFGLSIAFPQNDDHRWRANAICDRLAASNVLRSFCRWIN